jgi:two-component system NtrC family sensor kinase
MNGRAIGTMLNTFAKSKMAIIGGGRFCRMMLQLLVEEEILQPPGTILGVADLNPEAEGVRFAAGHGLPVTRNYHDLLALDGLQLVVELTGDGALAKAVEKENHRRSP